LPQDLDLQRLAAEQPLKVPDALFEPPHLRAPDNWLIRSHSRSSAFAHQPAPAIQQIGRDAAPAGDRRYRLAGLQALLDDLQLLVRRPMPAPRAFEGWPLCQDAADPGRPCLHRSPPSPASAFTLRSRPV